MVRYKAELIRRAVRLYISGKSARKVADLLGVSGSSVVLRWLELGGIPVRHGGWGYGSSLKQNAINLYDEGKGMPIRQIARLLGPAEVTLRLWFHKAGVFRTKPGYEHVAFLVLRRWAKVRQKKFGGAS